MGACAQHPHDDPARSVFCNRTLNLRSIRAIGFDMDYTLIEYDVMAWEGRAYEYGARQPHTPPSPACPPAARTASVTSLLRPPHACRYCCPVCRWLPAGLLAAATTDSR